MIYKVEFFNIEAKNLRPKYTSINSQTFPIWQGSVSFLRERMGQYDLLVLTASTNKGEVKWAVYAYRNKTLRICAKRLFNKTFAVVKMLAPKDLPFNMVWGENFSPDFNPLKFLIQIDLSKENI